MSDLPIVLPTADSAENIPAVLAAPKPKRGKLKAVALPVEPGVAPVETAMAEVAPAKPTTAGPVEPCIAEPAPSLPTAAVPADLPSEEPTMTDTIENMTHDTAAKTQAMFGEMNERAKSAMERGTAMFADWNSFGRDNVEALVESGKIAMSGLSTLAQDRAAYVRKQVEDTTAAVRTMASAKSPTEFVKLQGDFVREQFDAMVAETSRSTEAMLKLVGEVAQPISNRVALAADKVRYAA